MFAAIFALSAVFGQSPAPSSAGSPNLQELQKQLQQLKQENQLLRELLTQGNTTTATVPVKPATAQSAQTAVAAGSSDQQSLTHWLRTSSSKRHKVVAGGIERRMGGLAERTKEYPVRYVADSRVGARAVLREYLLRIQRNDPGNDLESAMVPCGFDEVAPSSR
jgi:hypothetical protein